MTKIFPFPKERQHTLVFLQYAKNCSPVFIDTDVDMRKILELQAKHIEENQTKYSIITYFIYAAARVISNYPEANSSFSGGVFPKIAQYETVNAKFTLDKHIGKQRVVVAALVPNADQLSLSAIQQIIDYYKAKDFTDIEEFSGIQKLQKFPFWISQLLFNLIGANLVRKKNVLGTFSVSSLGHKPIQSFFSVGGTTLTFGLGRIQAKPVVQDEQIKIVHLMRLSMTFDHRLIDGAMSADILNDIKDYLDNFYE
ncbi:MAG: 2-oxo acid dehydrogenase [Microcystis wesenbergii Mw_QC_B_20070930_S4]|jgi:pyruvate/2-oxoglutarate dehydrogenase complex dihydrolipoamide acyltransferase (E2) component|nr:MAG: 2-oxo acid dehydrogenase [Microcystis wesenbergii Mw_QC_B_20070930_S4D]TRV15808.1 MAG: 2-oxo acid dehydrogenase [Microcystis wesenbergii Mw_QC_B_20070930_S4]